MTLLFLTTACGTDKDKTQEAAETPSAQTGTPDDESAHTKDLNSSRKAEDRISLSMYSEDGGKRFLVVADTLAARVDTLFPGGDWLLKFPETDRTRNAEDPKLVFECLAYTNYSSSSEPCLTPESMGETADLQDMPDVKIFFDIGINVNKHLVFLELDGYNTVYPAGGDMYHYLDYHNVSGESVLPLRPL